MPKKKQASALGSNSRVQPMNLSKKMDLFLLRKFSREPIWKALNDATPNVLPKWRSSKRPALAVREGFAVWQYTLPQDFTNVTSFYIAKKGGGRRVAYRFTGNPVTISTGIKTTSPERLFERFESNVTDRRGTIIESQLTAEEIQKIYDSHERAIEQWIEDRFRITVLWESISAAIAAGYYIWNRWNRRYGSANEQEGLDYLAPFFEAVGIDVHKVWKFAFKTDYFGIGKRPDFIPGKASVGPYYDYYMKKELEKGRIPEAFEELPEISQKIIRAAATKAGPLAQLARQITEWKERGDSEPNVDENAKVKQKSNSSQPSKPKKKRV